MNIVFLSNVSDKQRVQREIPEIFSAGFSVRFYPLGASADEIGADGDADVLVVDAMGSVEKELIDVLPSLKLIQSEGVGYQGIDLEAAANRGVAVCNNPGINDTAVAEQAIMLMLSCLKNARNLDQAVRIGRQIETKKEYFGKLKELSECTVGLIGFGKIARKTAQFLKPFGARVLYSNRTRYEELEREYSVSYADIDTLLGESDIVSLHLPANSHTAGIADASFFNKMKNGACFINTARGELVDNNALVEALLNERLSMAGLDVIAPEPVMPDNPLLDKRIEDKILFSPHIGGLSSATVSKLYQGVLKNIIRIQNSEEPINRV